MDIFILRLYGCRDVISAVPYTVLRKTQTLLILAHISLGIACLARHGIELLQEERGKDGTFFLVSVLAFFYALMAVFCRNVLRLIWALALHVSVFLILLGLLLYKKSDRSVACVALAFGILAVAFICLRSTCVGKMFVSDMRHLNGRPPIPATEVV